MASEAHRLSTLQNGVRVATERIDSVRSVALGIWIAAGSRQEPVNLGGVSHFIEHLIFKGSDRYDALAIARIFDDMGGEPNASTSKEYTLVNARFLDDDLDKAFEVIAEMVARPTFADLDQEREVVLEEVAMYEDSPPELIHDDLCEVVFGEHPLGRPIIGHSETLAGLDLATVKTYHGVALREPGHRGRRPPATSITTICASSPRRTSPAGPGRGAARRAQRARLSSRGAFHAERHRAVSRVPRRSGATPLRPRPLRRVRGRHHARRLMELAAFSGGPREARARLLGVLVHLAVSPMRVLRQSISDRAKKPWKRP